MNRELKVAAVLGILVVGFAAVMVLGRKDEAGSQERLPVENFADLDKEIADQQHTPHLTGIGHSHSEAADSASSYGHHGTHTDREPDSENFLASDYTEHESSSDSWSAGDDPSEEKNSPPYESDETTHYSHVDADMEANEDRADFPNDSDEELSHNSEFNKSRIPQPISSLSKKRNHLETSEQLPDNQGWQGVTETTPRNKQRNKQLSANHGFSRGRIYVVESGDTLSSIATRFLGRSERARDIFNANRSVLTDPNRLRVGTKIVIPQAGESHRGNADWNEGPVAETDRGRKTDRGRDRSSLFRPVSRSPFMSRSSESNNGSRTTTTEFHPNGKNGQSTTTYQVRRGDTLERIARQHYGRRGKATDIYRANQDRLSSPNDIRTGMTLILP